MLEANKRWRLVDVGDGEKGSIQRINLLQVNREDWKPIKNNLTKRLIDLQEKGIAVGTQVKRFSPHEVLIRGGAVLIRYSFLTCSINIIASSTRNTNFLPLTIKNLQEIQEECRKWSQWCVKYHKEVFK